MDAVQLRQAIQSAARAIKQARFLIITAGAGMGVDSGLPDFRGAEGFWKTYPPLKKRGLTLPQVSTPSWFNEDPNFAWWFFGHRIDLYRRTKPHRGFEILLEWARTKTNYFVFTSNVDNQFQKAGFDDQRIIECHGSIMHMQCVNTSVSDEIWPVPDPFEIKIDHENLRAIPPLPLGPPSGSRASTSLARPNVLMFNDWTWIGDRTEAQQQRYNDFLEKQIYGKDDPFVVIEMGAGHAVPTVRLQSEQLTSVRGTLIRINPVDFEIRAMGSRLRYTQASASSSASSIERYVSIALGSLECLERIQTELQTLE